MRQMDHYKGYKIIFLYSGKDGKDKKEFVHFLVASTFLDNPKNLPIVNHKDLNKKNNNTNNLEWNTYSENTRHYYASTSISVNDIDIVVRKEIDGEAIPF